MRTPAVALVLLLSACASAPVVDHKKHAQELAQRFLILDGHIDVPYRLHAQRGGVVDDVGLATEGGDFDWPRAKAGGLDAPFMSIYTPAEDEAKGTSKQEAERLIDLVEGIVRAHPDRFALAKSPAEVRAIAAQGKLALLLGMENGSPIEGKLENVDHFYLRGVRYITLCHGLDNQLCDSSYDTHHTHSGLSPFGREVVRRMNELGIMIDISHLGDDSLWQVLELTKAPVIASHSSLRYFTPGFERNMSDAMVRALKQNGGVVQINFGSSFLTAGANQVGFHRNQELEAYRTSHNLAADSEEMRDYAARWDREHPFPFADVKDVADHIDRAVKLAGIDHVGLGSDFDGVGDSLPTGLKDVSMYPNLIAELLRRGYKDGDIEKICGANVLRVMERCEAVARELQSAGAPHGQ